METINIQNAGVSLLDRSRKGLTIFSYVGLVVLLLVLQVGFMIAIACWFEDFIPHYFAISTLFALGMVLYLINSAIDPTAKITWLLLIMLLPVFGTVLFLYIRNDVGHRTLATRFAQMISRTRGQLH